MSTSPPTSMRLRATPAAAAAPQAPRAILPAFAALVLAMLPAVLDQTILGTALPTIAGDLGRLEDVSWLVTGYVVAATAATPVWGKLGDRHGRRSTLTVALAWFLGASALCGVAQDITQLIAARAVQGLAAGGLMAMAMASVGDLVAPRERARWQGRIATVFGVATVAGPVVGGLLVQHASWRWVFYVNLPLGLLALGGIARFIPRGTPAADRKPFDAAGAALLALAIAAALLALSWAGDRYGWLSGPVAALAGTAIAATAAFARRERRAPDPLVPVAVTGLSVVRVAAVGLFLVTASLFAVLVFVPLGLQRGAGLSPTGAGLMLAASTLGMAGATTFAGRFIARTGRLRRLPPLGSAVMAAGLAALSVTATDGSAATVAALVVFGAGFGLTSQLLTVAVQNGVPREQIGVATAGTSFFRALGGATGAACLGATFAALGAPLNHAVHVVLLCAAPIALAAAAVTLRLPAAVDR